MLDDKKVLIVIKSLGQSYLKLALSYHMLVLRIKKKFLIA